MSRMSRAVNGAKGGAPEGGGLLPNIRSLSLSSPSKHPATDPSSEVCPVCKSGTYLNRNMRFLVNPECYHKMCEGCVDRIFSHGPAPCPIAGCNRTLRKAKFRSPTFEDLKMEREVDIRKEVASVFNKKQADFETLRDFNDYLETVEEVTWNLILDMDVEETRERLRKYREAQKAQNSSTTRRALDHSQASDKRKGATQRKALDVSSGNTPEPFATNREDTGFSFRGLIKRKTPEPPKSFDPFDGWSIQPQYHILQDKYDVGWMTAAGKDANHSAGGYSMPAFYSQVLCDAFSGFGVFVEDEIKARETQASMDAGVGTRNAAMAAQGTKDVNMDDVF
ncbi:RNA polymerase II transcription factor-like protein B subunit 3 [Lophiotrema nucula]|uniref:RNA polymerase II transcription factor B subunit 3 n=1 Tax=Lophiotrema nucula TaxID=690887 RepID=A0A6A5ZC54_9PLEO|nr:RNA polymerase II transcription factor-like protein B subunit 3 [Lophiotrema nucula]